MSASLTSSPIIVSTNQLLKASCLFFASELLNSSILEAPFYGKFVVGPQHLLWDELISKNQKLCLLAPRGHGKTWFFDFAYVLWQAYIHPGGSTYIFSATQPLANLILRDIKNELEGNPKLKFLLPKGARQSWAASSISLKNGHTITAKGYGSKVRGRHPTAVILDDVLGDNSLYSEGERKKAITYFFTAITGMCMPSTQLIVVGTPMHSLDLYGVLEKNPTYKFKRYSAIQADGTALWPGLWSIERLMAKKLEVNNNILFNREYLCRCISDDTSLFPDYLFKGSPREQPDIRLGMAKSFWDTKKVQVFMGVDFAMSSSVEADYTVITVLGLDRYGNRWIMDLHRRKGMPYQKQLDLITTVARKYEPALILLESNQMQRIFGDELIRLTDLPIKNFNTGAAKHSIEKGIPSMRIFFENKKYRIPMDFSDPYTREMIEEWLAEFQGTTFIDGKVQVVGCDHDDMLMSNYICEQGIKMGAFCFSFGEDDASTESLEDIYELGDKNDEDEELSAERLVEDVVQSGNLIDDSFNHSKELPSWDDLFE